MPCQKPLQEIFLQGTLVTSKLAGSSMLQETHSEHGQNKARLIFSDQEEKEPIGDTMLENLSLETAQELLAQTKRALQLEKQSVMQESQRELKQTICKDRLNSCEKNTLHMSLSQTLDLVSTTKEKVLRPFWNAQVKDNSKSLWLPTRTACVDSVSSSWNSSFSSLPMLKSWFLNKQTVPLKRSLLKTSLILPQCLPQELTVKESTKNPQNKEPAQRSLRLRIFQTPEQRQLVNRWLGAFRYASNRTLDIIDIMTQTIQEPEKKNTCSSITPTGKCLAIIASGKNKGKLCDKTVSIKSSTKLYCGKHAKKECCQSKLKKKKFTFPSVRQELLRHELQTKVEENVFSYTYVPRFPKRENITREMEGMCTAVMKNNEICGKKCASYSLEYCSRHFRLEKTLEEKSKPEWLENLEVPTEIWKGACKQTVENFNSAVTNVGSNFTMKYKTKKDPHQNLMFGQWMGTDNPMYKEYGQIKGSCRVGKKYYNAQTLLNLLKTHNERRGFSLNIDQHTGKAFLLFPVGYNFLKSFQDSETQAPELKEIIAFDPGVRCFLTGFAGNHIWEFGKGSNTIIFKHLVKANFLKARIARKIKPKYKKKYKRKMVKLALKVKHMVTDMQWKLAGFVTRNYKHIFIPPFEVSEMLRSKELKKPTKMQLTALRFYQFKQKLIYRVTNSNSCHLYTPTEEYTTRTCTNCGSLKTIKEEDGTVVYCRSCHTRVPRDFAGARNYYLKSLYGEIAQSPSS